MKLYIAEKLEEYNRSRPLRFHTPGHKGALNCYDITEIDDSFPGDAVIKAQEQTAKRLKSKYCRYLLGGSSMGIKAAVLAAKGDILVAENSHRAIFEAAELAGVKAFTVECPKEYGLSLPVTPFAVERALREHPSVKAVYVTSPDYYGLCAQKEISDVVKGRAYLFCDGAHGAHFPFRPDLFPQSFSEFADITNLSAHKTLPAYTQTAYLAVNNDELIGRVDEALRLLGTTSPSYVLLSSLEHAAEYTFMHKGEYDSLKLAVDTLRFCLPTLQNDDFTRVAVDAESLGLSGKELYLRMKQNGVIAEKYDDRYVVFIITIMDTPQAVDKLRETLCSVSL